MKEEFLKQTKLHATKEELFRLLESSLEENQVVYEKQSLDEVYQEACRAYEGVNRYSGDEYVTHPLNVAILLSEMGAEYETMVAGLFCDVLQKTSTTLEQLKLPKKSEEIIISLQELNLTAEYPLEKEPALLVKLAERLHNMRTIEFMPEEQKKVKAKETLEIFMPIADKLGNKKMKQELEVLAKVYK